MILKQPYEFKALKLMNTTQTVAAINRYIAIDYVHIKNKRSTHIKPFSNIHTTLNPVILYGLSDTEKDIPHFGHPIINTENKWIALDLRQYVKLNDSRDDVEIRNESEYNLALHRFILTAMWFTEKQSSLYALKLPHFCFATWLSENLGRKFGLDLSAQLQLKVLALIYYSHLFGEYFTEEDLAKLTIRVREEVVFPSIVEEIYSRVDKLDNIDDFCKACYDVTGNIRLKGLDYDVLLNTLNNNWIGSNGKELALLSLEHPPTWISLVYAGLTQRSFKKNFVTSVVDKNSKRGKGDEFLKALQTLTHEYIQE